MLKYSKNDIELAKGYFERKKYQRVDAALDSHNFSFYILPQHLNHKLPDFAYRCTTGNPQDGGVFGVSDSLPPEFRPHWALHEIVEFTEIGMDAPDRCVRALEKELAIVPEQIRPDYVRRRRAFFENLIRYAQDNPKEFTAEDVKEFQKSYQHLEQLSATLIKKPAD